MEKPLKLTISIVNTNNRELVKNCLISIYESVKRCTFEIILVDNCSKDGSVEMVMKDFKDVIIIQNESVSGYGFCHNRAIRIAKGQYILIFNEDMIVLNNAIDLMVERIEKDNNIGVLGCKLLNPDGNLQYASCSNFPNIKQHIIDTLLPREIGLKNNKYRRFLYYYSYNTEKEVDIIQGSCMLIPKRVFKDVGVFDTRFFVYSEEDDLCRRIKDNGYKIILYPKSEIIHIGGQTSKKMSLKMALIMIDSKIKYYQKHHNRIEITLFKLIYLFGNICRITGWSAIALFKKNERKYCKSEILMNIKSIELISKKLLEI